jgi:hypothetical protein
VGRAELEKDVAFALRTAQGEARYAMEMEVRRAVGALLDDAVQVTAAACQEEVDVRGVMQTHAAAETRAAGGAPAERQPSEGHAAPAAA